MNTKNFPSYAPVVLRLALSAVFLWFGTSQLLNFHMWVGLVPGWATQLLSLSAVTIVHMNGVFEIVMGLLLVFGVYTRWVALLLALHLFVITTHLGLSAIGVRDFGLSFATLAVALHGDDAWALLG